MNLGGGMRYHCQSGHTIGAYGIALVASMSYIGSIDLTSAQ
jgi:hypothetical protein